MVLIQVRHYRWIAFPDAEAQSRQQDHYQCQCPRPHVSMTQSYEGTNEIHHLPSAALGRSDQKQASAVVRDDHRTAVVETVVRTPGAAVGQAGRGGTPWTVGPGQAGRGRPRWEVWDGCHSSHNPEVAVRVLALLRPHHSPDQHGWGSRVFGLVA